VPPLYLLEGFLTAEECQACSRGMDAGVPDPAEVLVEGISPRDQVRRAETVDVAPEVLAMVETRLDQARDRIARHFDAALTDREGTGFVRYQPGGFYRPHIDWAESPDWPDAARRQVAVVVFLNSSRAGDAAGEFDGGVLRLLPDAPAEDHVEIVPRRGTLVAFPAAMPHEVTTVVGGVRDAAVDWYYARR
jgi:predicted 2-oxoglutarate/Fe(II)-dependent dioxygenase YbiX